MKSGKYTLRELFLNKNIEQIIVPEIQRDYVWKKEQVISILDSITEDYKKFDMNDDLKILNCIDDDIIKTMFETYYKKQKYSSNIGFIYAYNDAEYKDKYFLIDGQQRLTTMYLMIFSIYNLLNRKEDFVKYYFNQSILKLDYKVRDSSHDFLIDFITHVSNNFDIEEIENKYWYFSKYNSDRTIKSIKENYQTITKYFSSMNNLYNFKEYVENYIEFWFFDTNISKQGEELYLSMNSRGESMQSNENLKALLLKESLTKNDYGLKWEDWQHFFWINKGSSINADEGFNLFIRFIIISEVFSVKSDDSDKKKEVKLFEILESKNFIHYIEYLNLDIVEQYIKAIKKLDNLNLLDKYWLSGDVKNIIRLIEILPLLRIIYSNDSLEYIDYLRYKNFFMNITRFIDIAKNPDTYLIRTIELVSHFESIPKDVIELRDITNKEYMNIITSNEQKKMLILNNNDTIREEIEKAFWEIEAHELLKGNLDFIFKLIDTKNFNLEEFNMYKSLFIELFPNKISNKVRQALLVFGDYGILDGWTYHKARYSFEITSTEWNNKQSDILHECTKKLLINITSLEKHLSLNDKLDIIINQFNDREDWRYYFIRDNRIFNDARKSKITWDSDEQKPILILERNNGNNGYKEFSEYVKKIKNKL